MQNDRVSEIYPNDRFLYTKPCYVRSAQGLAGQK